MVTLYFADTSAFAKRYLVEFRSLIARRVREGNLTTAAASSLTRDFQLHYQHEYLAILADTPIYQAAGQLVTKHRLRSLDAIQLACAIHAFRILGDRITFVSSDHHLLTAASSEGFTTDDPNQHP